MYHPKSTRKKQCKKTAIEVESHNSLEDIPYCNLLRVPLLKPLNDPQKVEGHTTGSTGAQEIWPSQI